ncbi:hypothetical protein ACRRVD_02575 [Candidatus Cardinium hertigii]|uniref:hypothetical protein n=1 Tax=Candidatus Cardinium hertigii TaxID=247481 RepID=UPI003D7CC50D
MNKYKIKSIVFSALWGMAILNSGAASCSKEKKPTREAIIKQKQKATEKEFESQIHSAASSLGLQEKDADDAIKIMYGKIIENETKVSKLASYLGTTYKKILKCYKQFISGELTEGELDKKLDEVDNPNFNKKLFKVGLLKIKRGIEEFS